MKHLHDSLPLVAGRRLCISPNPACWKVLAGRSLSGTSSGCSRCFQLQKKWSPCSCYCWGNAPSLDTQESDIKVKICPRFSSVDARNIVRLEAADALTRFVLLPFGTADTRGEVAVVWKAVTGAVSLPPVFRFAAVPDAFPTARPRQRQRGTLSRETKNHNVQSSGKIDLAIYIYIYNGIFSCLNTFKKCLKTELQCWLSCKWISVERINPNYWQFHSEVGSIAAHRYGY